MKRILVIDDEVEVLNLIRRVLKRAGYEVMKASGGEEGINLIKENPVDLVITDIVMPDKGGIEVLINLHRDFPALKKIVMSGKIETESDSFQELAKQFGASYILHKPFKMKELLTAVAEALI